MGKVCVINVVGLTPELVQYAPRISKLGTPQPLRSPLPAVTTTAQATMLTGLPPSKHGIVGNGWFRRDLSVWHGRQIEVPVTFLAGRQDWGWAQFPGALEALESRACTDYRGTHLIDGAGHWVQQEQPEAVVEEILGFVA